MTAIHEMDIIGCRFTGSKRSKPFYVTKRTINIARAMSWRFMCETFLSAGDLTVAPFYVTHAQEVALALTNWKKNSAGIQSYLRGPFGYAGGGYHICHDEGIPKHLLKDERYMRKGFRGHRVYYAFDQSWIDKGYREVPTLKVLETIPYHHEGYLVDVSGIHLMSAGTLTEMIIQNVYTVFLQNTLLDLKDMYHIDPILLKEDPDAKENEPKKLIPATLDEIMTTLYHQHCTYLKHDDIPPVLYNIDFVMTKDPDAPEDAWREDSFGRTSLVEKTVTATRKFIPNLRKIPDQAGTFYFILSHEINSSWVQNAVFEGIKQVTGLDMRKLQYLMGGYGMLGY